MVQIFSTDARIDRCLIGAGRRARLGRFFRVTHAGQVVIGQRREQHAHCAEHHRCKHAPAKTGTVRVGQYHQQRQCTCRRVQAAQQAHADHCQTYGQARAVEAAAKKMHHPQRHDRGAQIAADNRPGLRQCTRGHGKQQNGRSAQRADQVHGHGQAIEQAAEPHTE